MGFLRQDIPPLFKLVGEFDFPNCREIRHASYSPRHEFILSWVLYSVKGIKNFRHPTARQAAERSSEIPAEQLAPGRQRPRAGLEGVAQAEVTAVL